MSGLSDWRVEVFLDFVEKIDAILDRNGNTVSASLKVSPIQMRALRCLV